MGIFAETGEVPVKFPDGWTIYLKSEMDAGDQEEIDNAMMRGRKGEGDEMELALQSGKLKLLEINIKRIESPQGVQEVTAGTVRRLSREVMAKLLVKIDELNPLFFDLMRKAKEG